MSLLREARAAPTWRRHPMTDAGEVKLTERLIAERDEARRQLAETQNIASKIADGLRDQCRERTAERDRLRDAITHVVNDSPGTPDSVKAFLRAALAESEETT